MAELKVLARPAFRNRIDNPYNSLLYDQVEAYGIKVAEFTVLDALTRKVDIIHVHWPESFLSRPLWEAAFKSAALLILLRYVRYRGAKLVWTVHNLNSHDGQHRLLEEWFWNSFLRQVDAAIYLGKATKEAASRRFPQLRRLPAFIVPHGHYRGEFDSVSAVEARRSLKVQSDAIACLFFGQVRPYKNVVGLVRAFRLLRCERAVLLIAGRPASEPLKREVEAAAGSDTRVRLFLSHIEPKQVPTYFSAINLCIFPYSDVLNSGAAMLALSFNRPVLLPKTPAFTELQEEVGEAWVRLYDGELTGSVLDRALEWSAECPRSTEAPLQAFEWPRLGELTATAYESVVKSHTRPQ